MRKHIQVVITGSVLPYFEFRDHGDGSEVQFDHGPLGTLYASRVQHSESCPCEDDGSVDLGLVDEDCTGIQTMVRPIRVLKTVHGEMMVVGSYEQKLNLQLIPVEEAFKDLDSQWRPLQQRGARGKITAGGNFYSFQKLTEERTASRSGVGNDDAFEQYFGK